MTRIIKLLKDSIRDMPYQYCHKVFLVFLMHRSIALTCISQPTTVCKIDQQNLLDGIIILICKNCSDFLM